jgi:hypothetical protein
MDKFFLKLKQNPDLRAGFGAKLHSIDGEVASLSDELNDKRNQLILEGMAEFAGTHGYKLSPDEVKKAYISECRKIDADYKTYYKDFFMEGVVDEF